jgi:PiT family inorganic phosphate transporter
MELALAIACSLAFALTNGFHDAANAIATLVATRGASPGHSIVLSAVFNMLGATIAGTAVADTIGGIVVVPPDVAVAVIGSGVLGATVWNVITWRRGLPSSSGHALVGGLVGAALATSGADGVLWGGIHGWRPVGVFGVVIALAVSPVIGLVFGTAIARLTRWATRRATGRVHAPIRFGEWAMSAALSFSHGSNDGQKAMGVTAALLVAGGHLNTFAVPLWVKVTCGLALTIGTAMGGWTIIRTIGRRILHLHPIDGFTSQTSSTAVILASSYVGAPVSTTQVVASSIVGIGVGRRRWHHVRWAVVRAIGFAWVVTLPAAAALGAAVSIVWVGTT